MVDAKNKDKPNTLAGWKGALRFAVPPLSAVLAAAEFMEDATQPTFCINLASLEVRYNPNFAAGQSFDDNVYVLAHEAAHALCQHGLSNARARAVADSEGPMFQPYLWTHAEEEAVNELVTSFLMREPPSGGVVPDVARAGMTTEQRYRHIKQNAKATKGCTWCHVEGGKDGGALPSLLAEALLRQAVHIGAQEAAQYLDDRPGNQPGELQRLALRLKPLTVKPDVRTMLRQWLQAVCMGFKDFDPATIDKRRLDLDGLCQHKLATKPEAMTYVVSMDNSGSIDNEQFSLFKGALDEVTRQLGFQRVVVQHFTTVVCHTAVVRSLHDVQQLDRRATGGTALDDCDRKAKGQGAFHIIITDGQVKWLARYSLPTVIVIHGDAAGPPKVRGLVGVVRI